MRNVNRTIVYTTVIVLMFTSLPFNTTFAMLVFGGSTQKFVPCVGGALITVGPPNGGMFFDSPATNRYAEYVPALLPGQWQLGEAGPPTPCFQPSVFPPIILGVGAIKIYEGTSLF